MPTLSIEYLEPEGGGTPLCLLSPIRRRTLERLLQDEPLKAIQDTLDLDALRRQAFPDRIRTVVLKARAANGHDKMKVKLAIREYRARIPHGPDERLPELTIEEQEAVTVLESYEALNPEIVSGWPSEEPLPIEFQEIAGAWCMGLIFPQLEEGRELFLPSGWWDSRKAN